MRFERQKGVKVVEMLRVILVDTYKVEVTG